MTMRMTSKDASTEYSYSVLRTAAHHNRRAALQALPAASAGAGAGETSDQPLALRTSPRLSALRTHDGGMLSRGSTTRTSTSSR